MKVAKILALAAAVSLGVTAAANAHGQVWFTATGTLPNSADDLGGPGQTLKVECDVTQGDRCEWLVQIFYQTSDLGGHASWGLDVGVLDPGELAKVNVKEFQIFQNALTATGTVVPTINQPDGRLISNAGGFTFDPAPSGLYLLMEFVLSKHKEPGAGLNSTEIWAGIGPTEFGGINDPDGYNYWDVLALGPNDPVVGLPYGWPDPRQTQPLMIINNVPEPATLGLLGLGLLTLIRRRR